MSIEKIVATLEKLEKMHKSLLELALAKTEYIKVGDMENLDKLIKKLEDLGLPAADAKEEKKEEGKNCFIHDDRVHFLILSLHGKVALQIQL